MKKTYLTIFLSLISLFALRAQNITGSWYGILKGPEMHLTFHIEETENGYSALMDSPDQQTFGIPVHAVSFENNKLRVEIPSIGLVYEGVLTDKEIIEGTFTQFGSIFQMNLSRNEIVKLKRPQEPKKPYPYHSEDIYFENEKAGITLAGTFTYPATAGKYPAVVLISGSGAQNRDEELMGHKPFLVLSDYLTRNKIAVLRFDDRGTAESTGNIAGATSQDFATDVEAAVKYLKTRNEVDKNKIGLIGHSEGGIIAPIVASKNNSIAFIVLMAGTGLPGRDVILMQQELIGRASGVDETTLLRNRRLNETTFEILFDNEGSSEQKKQRLTEFLKTEITEEDMKNYPSEITKEMFVNMQLEQIFSPWILYFLEFDPATVLEKVRCPVLAINGEKDLQVPPKENLSAIEKALKKGGNRSYKIIEFPNLNHIFQEAETGAPSEYITIEQTISPIALEAIADWINDLK